MQAGEKKARKPATSSWIWPIVCRTMSFLAAGITAAAGRSGPGDFKAMAIAVVLVGGEGDARRQIDIEGDRGQGRT